MRRAMFIAVLTAVSGLFGCEGDNTPDSNVHIFQNVQNAAALRQAQQERAWKQIAVEVLSLERQDIKATPAEEAFAVQVEADAVRQTIDLSPVWDTLVALPERSAALLREHLVRELRAFDQQRLMVLSPGEVKGRVIPILVSGREADEIALRRGGPGAVPRTLVAADLHWLPAIQWPSGAFTAIGNEALNKWGMEAKEIQSAALENLHPHLNRPADELFETIPFGPAGRLGQLRPGVPQGVILLPGFIQKVDEAWGTSGPLAILAASRNDIRFVSAENKPMLDMIYPGWKDQVDSRPDALVRRVLLLSDEGLALHDTYQPPVRIDVATTRPFSLPGGITPGGAASGGFQPRGPTSRPTRPQLPGPSQRPYIVR